MNPQIIAVTKGSPAHKAGITPHMSLLRMNGHAIQDVLDYRFYSYDRRLVLDLCTPEGTPVQVQVTHAEGGDIGLQFATYLMDKPRHCQNKCVFCFIDQQPSGLRDSLYFKDDDARLSFLQGNYITLTNLSQEDVNRILQQRISPVRVSVHTTQQALRARMLGNPTAGTALTHLTQLAAGKISLHCQIVLCPTLNDGAALTQSLEDLARLGDAVESVSVVPVGLTRYREGLYPLTPLTCEQARDCITRCAPFDRVYAADELFIKAQLPIPTDAYYDDYPQLENGVGMIRTFLDDFQWASEGLTQPKQTDITLVTGTAFAPFLRDVLTPFGLQGCVQVIENTFWGATITVAGLVVGQDIVAQLQGKVSGTVYVPSTMLRHGGDLFLDDMTPKQVSDALGVPVTVIPAEGAALAELLLR